MGWNSYNAVRWSSTEPSMGDVNNVIAAFSASFTNSNGVAVPSLKSLGYKYINIDYGWATTSRALGADGYLHLVADPNKFPPSGATPGIEVAANVAHANGFKLGIYVYMDTGCGSGTIPRTHTHTEIDTDAHDFADWGVDYVKYDRCGAFSNQESSIVDAFEYMGARLAYYNPSIVYSINPHSGGTLVNAQNGTGPWASPHTVQEISNVFRVGQDVVQYWSDPSGYWGLHTAMDQDDYVQYKASIGHWNDSDMFSIGEADSTHVKKSPLSDPAQYANVQAWAILGSPMLLSTDVTAASWTTNTRSMIANADLVAINQNTIQPQGTFIGAGSKYIWEKVLDYNSCSFAVLLYNTNTTTTQTVTVNFTQLGWTSTQQASVRDVSLQTNPANVTGSYGVSLSPLTSKMVTLTLYPYPNSCNF
jgi:alpha-galactosidase